MNDTLTAIEANGMAALGYDYFTLDDCFAMRRDASDGTLYPDPVRFPQGFAPLVSRAHALGLKFGICELLPTRPRALSKPSRTPPPWLDMHRETDDVLP